MVTHDTRIIKGWRSRMEDEAAELRKRVWQAPAMVVYHEGLSPPDRDDLAGHERWFHREFGEERAIARAELKRHRSARMRIAFHERSDEQREAANAYIRAWRAKQPDEWRESEALKKRQRRAANPELYQAIDRRHEERRRDKRNAQRREAYALNPELHRARRKARRSANLERARTTARAAYARQKARQQLYASTEQEHQSG